jgi:hypothetical protein
MGSEVFAVPDEHVDDIIRVFIYGLNSCAGGVHPEVNLNVRKWAFDRNPEFVGQLDRMLAQAKKRAAKSKRDRMIEQGKRRKG